MFLSGRLLHFKINKNPLFIRPLILLIVSNLIAGNVSVSWQPNSESDVAGYKIYYGFASREYQQIIDVGMNLSYNISSIPDTSVTYFAVTAYDSAGNESEYSREAKLNFGDLSQFALNSNFPNPFNPETTIQFSIFMPVKVQLTVYDMLGREVKLLLDSELFAGDYEVSWDSTNEMGISVAGGIYFCRLLVGHFAQTRKLILVR